MTTFNTFEDIDAWQEARVLIRQIRSICKRPNVRRDYTFVDQITRSARSIAANIAEGSETTSNAEFARFLDYAKRSAGEVRAHLYDALDEKYISQNEFNDLAALTKKIGKMIGALMQYLRGANASNP